MVWLYREYERESNLKTNMNKNLKRFERKAKNGWLDELDEISKIER